MHCMSCWTPRKRLARDRAEDKPRDEGECASRVTREGRPDTGPMLGGRRRRALVREYSNTG